jgi:NAD(P)-dependent dehydrogenase (short-subunit alcohol dehydrogenase family)
MKEGRLLIVTGGNRGIGKQIALSAVDAGWRVAISYGSNQKCASDIENNSKGQIKAFPLDVSKTNSIEKFFRSIESWMGPSDALVTAAGIDNGERAVEELDYHFVSSTMNINVVGLILCCQQFAKQAKEARKGGVIVNISSMASTIGGRRHKSVYAASKGAVDVFTVGAAKELAPQGISVFSIRPGVTRTDMTNAALANADTKATIEASIACGSVAEPSDIAKPVIDLISGNFDYASGSMLNLSGGGFVI